MKLLGRRKQQSPIVAGVKDHANGLEQTAGAMVGLGAICLGLVGLANFDPIGAILGRRSAASRLAYSLIGASAAYIAARGISEARN
ncbi:MAG: DUF378 domain-containing protein [Actinomycetota bacterium]